MKGLAAYVPSLSAVDSGPRAMNPAGAGEEKGDAVGLSPEPDALYLCDEVSWPIRIGCPGSPFDSLR